MNNKYKKTAKKVGVMGLRNLYEVGLRKIRSKVQSCSPKLKIEFMRLSLVRFMAGVSEVRLPKIFMRLSLVRFKEVGVLRSCDVLRLGIMIFAMVAVWAVLPANGAEAAEE